MQLVDSTRVVEFARTQQTYNRQSCHCQSNQSIRSPLPTLPNFPENLRITPAADWRNIWRSTSSLGPAAPEQCMCVSSAFPTGVLCYSNSTLTPVEISQTRPGLVWVLFGFALSDMTHHHKPTQSLVFQRRSHRHRHHSCPSWLRLWAYSQSDRPHQPRGATSA